MKKKKTDRTGCISVIALMVMVIAFVVCMVGFTLEYNHASCLSITAYTLIAIFLLVQKVKEEKPWKAVIIWVILFGLIELILLIPLAMISVIKVIG